MTDEEIADLQAKAARADVLEGKVKEYEEDEGIKNWRQIRQVNKSLKEAVEKSGKVVDDDGNITEVQKTISSDEVAQITTKEVERQLISKVITKAKKDLNDEDQKTFDRFYAKAVAGEEVNSDNADSFVEMAFNMAANAVKAPTAFARGTGEPRLGEKEESFADTERGKAMTAQYFGRKS